jgi:hypothetical protein
MPYKNPNTQRIYMRQKMRERRAASKRRDSLRSAPMYPLSDTAHHAVIPGAVIPINSERRQLLGGLQAPVSAGPDTPAMPASAQEIGLRHRQTRQTQTQADHRERDLRTLTVKMLPQARYWLQCNAGMWTEDMVTSRARLMAENTLHHRQAPRQGNPSPTLIAAPSRPDQGQQALPIWMGKIRPPVGVGHPHLPQPSQAPG